MSSRNKKMDFSSKIKDQVDAHKEEGQKSYGYLNLPKEISVYSVDIPKKLDSLKVKFDIIPYVVNDDKHPDSKIGATVGEAWWRRPILVHKNIGVDDESVICLQTIGKKCPVCEYKKELIKDKAAKEDIKALNYSKRSIYLVTPREDKDFDEELHIFDISDFCFYDPLMIDVEELNEYNFPSLEDGKTLQVRFNKETFAGNEFPKAIRVSFFERDEQLESSMLGEAPCLDDILNILTYDELSAKFFETGDPDDNEDKPKKGAVKDDDDNPKRSRQAKTTKSPEKKTNITWEILEIKSNRSLIRLVSDEGLKLDPADFDTEDELRLAIADELGIKPKQAKQSSSKSIATKETDSDDKNDEDITWDKINEMSPRRLKKLCADEGLETNPDDFDENETEALKIAIATELGIETPKTGKKASNRKSETNKSKSDNKCPSGYKFGVDTDKYPECETCPVWNPCLDLKETKK